MIAAIVLCGAGLVSAAFPESETRAAYFFRGVVALALGTAAFGALAMAGELARVPAWFAEAVAIAGGVALIASTRARGLRGATVRDPVGLLLPAATAVAALVVLAFFVEHSLRHPDGGWDARAIWNLRARALYLAPGRLDLVLSPELGESHPDYPLLWPSVVAAAYRSAGGPSAAAQALLAGWCGALLVAVTACAAAARRGAATGFLAALLLLGMPALLQQSWSQYADVPLAALLAAATALALDEAPGATVLAGLAAGCCALTKNEGLLWAAALGAGVLAANGRRAALRFLAGALPPLLLLAAFKLGFPRQSDLAWGTAADIARRALDLHRALAVAKGLVSQLWSFPAWGLCGPAVVVLALVARGERLLRVMLVLSLAAICAIYLGVPRPVEAFIASNVERLLMQLIGPAVLLALRAGNRPVPAPRGLRSV